MIQFIKQHYGKIGMSFAIVMLIINYYQRQELVELRTKVAVQTNSLAPSAGDIIRDSLELELFNEKTINGRYELSLEHLKEVNPKAANEFETYMSTQTE